MHKAIDIKTVFYDRFGWELPSAFVGDYSQRPNEPIEFSQYQKSQSSKELNKTTYIRSAYSLAESLNKPYTNADMAKTFSSDTLRNLLADSFNFTSQMGFKGDKIFQRYFPVTNSINLFYQNLNALNHQDTFDAVESLIIGPFNIMAESPKNIIYYTLDNENGRVLATPHGDPILTAKSKPGYKYEPNYEALMFNGIFTKTSWDILSVADKQIVMLGYNLTINNQVNYDDAFNRIKAKQNNILKAYQWLNFKSDNNDMISAIDPVKLLTTTKIEWD